MTNETISTNQLAEIGISAPSGATSFCTEAGEIVYVMGASGLFERRALAPEAARRLKECYGMGGSWGWRIVGGSTAEPFGKLAWEYCNKRLPLQVLRSQRGYYIGTFDEEAFGPCSRESEEYFESEDLARQAMHRSTWTQKMHP